MRDHISKCKSLSTADVYHSFKPNLVKENEFDNIVLLSWYSQQEVWEVQLQLSLQKIPSNQLKVHTPWVMHGNLRILASM